eukprot:TRINITY_DN8236_c0_g1_i1.p1 TRINITY_DN8236_c0_g1~~TRINITY_DN8236_c0_g1_i1.p1  ORF type:complete len:248 (-),score=73.38 TRINITY_DN8236_c0_g1_i1:278-1021(-)
MKFEIDVDYSTALDIFSNEAFYDFAAKIDFLPRESETTIASPTSNRTPPPQPIAPPAETPCSCCIACRQQQLQRQEQLQLQQQQQLQQFQQQQQQQEYYINYNTYQYVTTPVSVSPYDSPQASPVKVAVQASRKPRSGTEGPIQLQRTLQNRLIWSRALQHKFLEAVEYFGLDNAMPRGILNYMNSPTVIPGLTRANISSHLQKHRKKIAKKNNRRFEQEEEEDEEEYFEFDNKTVVFDGTSLLMTP